MNGFSALDWVVVVLHMGGIATFGLAKGGWGFLQLAFEG